MRKQPGKTTKHPRKWISPEAKIRGYFERNDRHLTKLVKLIKGELMLYLVFSKKKNPWGLERTLSTRD